jgi:hypothetical protein
MPRGRGRGRNVDPSITSANTTRNRRARSRRSRRARGSSSRSGGSLRRSSRLAEQTTQSQPRQADQQEQQEQQTVSHAPMASVARRAQTSPGLNTRAVEAEFSRERSRRNLRNRDDVSRGEEASGRRRLTAQRIQPSIDQSQPPSVVSDEDPSNYAMDILVQPPRSAIAGRSLTPAVTVRLRSLREDLDRDDLDVAHLLAVASLTAESEGTPDEQLQRALAGRRFDSVHPFTAEDANNYESAGIGFMSFPDLVIREQGTYRIRITLIRVRNGAGDSSPVPVGGSSVQVIDSDPVTIEGEAAEAGKRIFALRPMVQSEH